jgi:hypothetical protein
MPYGCLDSGTLSEASLKALERAVQWWRKSMQISKHQTYLILASYDQGSEAELELRRQFLQRELPPDEPLRNNIIVISGRNEDELAQKIVRNRDLLPIDTITVFAESRHAISLRPIFRRKFGKVLELKTFKAEFEVNHPWISTSTSSAWVLWNITARFWFEIKKRMGRNLRKKLRFLFRP